jgi:hypothetical protein
MKTLTITTTIHACPETLSTISDESIIASVNFHVRRLVTIHTSGPIPEVETEVSYAAPALDRGPVL